MTGAAVDLAADLTATLGRLRAAADAGERLLAASGGRETETARGLFDLARSEADAALGLAARLADLDG